MLKLHVNSCEVIAAIFLLGYNPRSSIFLGKVTVNGGVFNSRATTFILKKSMKFYNKCTIILLPV